MGIKAAILTNNSSLKSSSAKFGFGVLQLGDYFGFEQKKKVLDNNHFNLVFHHSGADEKTNGKQKSDCH